MRKVLVFGTFDGIHEGHRAFLRQARAYGDRLIVAVAQDEVVGQLKHHPPRRNLETRINALKAEILADLVVPGDAQLGTYEVVRNYRPDVIALGYDQTALKGDVERHLLDFGWYVEIAVLVPHGPAKYHSGLQHKGSN